MHRIAFRSLVHNRGKALAALLGVAFASMMVLVQGGVYVGFLGSASGLIPRIGGDVWVMSRAAPAVDLGLTLPPETHLWAEAHACIERVRPLLIRYLDYRTPRGSLDSLLLVGTDPATRMVPWSFAAGLPQDLHGPMRVTIDESNLGKKFDITGGAEQAIGKTISLAGQTVHIAAVTRGIKAFSTAPYAFTNIADARWLAGEPEGAARFFVLDLIHPGCAPDVIASINRHPELEALTTDAFRQQTEDHWIGVSGVGALLAFSALLGFIVGAVIVAQTLFYVTHDHLRELGTLKALGALEYQVIGFVGWQALFLAGGGTVAGGLAAAAIARASKVLTITLSLEVFAAGSFAIVLMCALASATSLSTVAKLDPAEVFK